MANNSYHPAYLAFLEALYGSVPETVSFSDERFESIKNAILSDKHINLITIQKALSQKPVCNSHTFVSTIMTFDSVYNELQISPGKPDSTAYVLFRIKR